VREVGLTRGSPVKKFQPSRKFSLIADHHQQEILIAVDSEKEKGTLGVSDVPIRRLICQLDH
jgi:hypothetical protein